MLQTIHVLSFKSLEMLLGGGGVCHFGQDMALLIVTKFMQEAQVWKHEMMSC